MLYKYKTINKCRVNTRRLPGRVGELCLIKGDFKVIPRKYKTINICRVNTRGLPGSVGEFCLIKADIKVMPRK